jgi:hypothetical protein
MPKRSVGRFTSNRGRFEAARVGLFERLVGVFVRRRFYASHGPVSLKMATAVRNETVVVPLAKPLAKALAAA